MSESEKPVRGSESLMVQSVAKAFRVLEAFSGGASSLTLSEIAQRTGLDMSAAQRFSHTLVALGYLRREEQSRQYTLGLKVVDLAYNYTRSSALIARATPVLLHLSKESDETVNLTVPDGADVIFIARYPSRHVLNTDVITGMRLPACFTASGRAILSALSDKEQEVILRETRFHPHTSATPKDQDAVRALISRAKSDGYAIALEEYFLGDASIGAPIFGADGRVIGAINIGASTTRYNPGSFEAEYGQKIVAAARAISWA